ncbi:hypothetical protein [Bacillus badius]|uniref:hypothetical protein n=1 Tax=Bacillus badius TaxID=1455 RepID=UPI0005ADE643|nr:hypothetical protein [Bacillus badius]KIL74738.1 hypothetical protein SD78_1807 [Bacillus badius]
MYFVFVPSVWGGIAVEKFEYLDEAKDKVKELVEAGHRSVHVAQEIPMKLKVEVEF